MKNILAEKFPVDKLQERFNSSIDLFKEFMEDLYAKRSKLQQDVLDHQIKENEGEDERVENSKLLQEYNLQIADLENFAKNATSEELREEYSNRLFKVKQNKERVLKTLKKNSYNIHHLDSVHYALNKTGIKGIDEWADELGRWFETGALGEGTVTFGEKTYTYKSS
jgi:predicted  nucleic acid-binding Zn-ribbon protein